jgi:hypothetical protein
MKLGLQYAAVFLFVLSAVAAYVAWFVATATPADTGGQREISLIWPECAVGAAILVLASIAALLASRRY